MHRFLTLAMASVLLGLAFCSAASATTWPQNFSLYAGHNVRYTFDVATAGDIVVDVTWTGCGLSVLLTDPAGKVVNLPPVLKSPPAKVTYTATAADILKGKTWSVTIATPPAPAPSQRPVAQGSVTVKVPSPPAVSIPDLRRPTDNIHINTALLPPTIQSVTPDTGSPNDIVKINGTNLPLDKNAADVWFNLGANVVTRGTITNVTKSNSVVTYEVRVPGNDYVYNPCAGAMYVKIREGAQTNSLIFNFVPCRPSTITGHSPQYGRPGVMTTFTGTTFRQDDKVYFVVPGQGDVGASTSYHSVTEIAATVPVNYPTNVTKSIQCYVRYNCKGHWMNGPKYTYPLDPAVINAKPK